MCDSFYQEGCYDLTGLIRAQQCPVTTEFNTKPTCYKVTGLRKIQRFFTIVIKKSGIIVKYCIIFRNPYSYVLKLIFC